MNKKNIYFEKIIIIETESPFLVQILNHGFITKILII